MLPSGKLLSRWDWPKGRDPHSRVESLCFTPDGSRLAAAVFRQSAAYVWDLKTGREVSQLAHPQIYGLSFSPDGRTLVTAGWDSIIRFWETDTGRFSRDVKVADHDNGGDLRMYAVCHAPEGDLIATAHLDGTVRIWQSRAAEAADAFSGARVVLFSGPWLFRRTGSGWPRARWMAA